MNRKLAFPVCFLVLLVAWSPLFSSKADRPAQKRSVIYIDEGYVYPPNPFRTAEGSYLSISAGSRLRKFSASGDILWERDMYTSTSNVQYSWISAISETDDGYILIGNIWDWFDQPTHVLILKTGTNGDVQWSKAFESPEKIAMNAVSRRADGNYLAVGGSWTTDETALIKFTGKGDILWTRIFNGLPRFTRVVSQPVSDGIILAATGPEQESTRIVKISDSGNLVWKNSLQMNRFNLQALGGSSDNGIVLAGTLSDARKLVLVRLSSTGGVDWTTSYRFNSLIYVCSITRAKDAGYMITGGKQGKNGRNLGGFFVKVNSKRELVFHKKFGQPDHAEYAGQVYATADGGYVIFGFSYARNNNRMLFLNVSSKGTVPDCNFFHEFPAVKVTSPVATSRSFHVSDRIFFGFNASSAETHSAAFASTSSSACTN